MMPMPFRLTAVFSLTAAAITLSACQSNRSPAPSTVGRAALPTMERVAMAANACWFKSGDKAFSTYKLAMELTSYSGRPRILAVPKHAPEGLPLLVVQAEGNPARLDAFGPMMQGPAAERIKHDVTRWAAGDKGC